MISYRIMNLKLESRELPKNNLKYGIYLLDNRIRLQTRIFRKVKVSVLDGQAALKIVWIFKKKTFKILFGGPKLQAGLKNFEGRTELLLWGLIAKSNFYIIRDTSKSLKYDVFTIILSNFLTTSHFHEWSLEQVFRLFCPHLSNFIMFVYILKHFGN